jgi:hypothetical protein
MTASPSSPESFPPHPLPREGFRLALDKVDTINRWRAQYIVVYLVWLAIQAYFYWLVVGRGMQLSLAAMLGANALLILFYVRFVPVLRAMGYPFWTWAPACLIAALPIPGVLVVAYLDRGMGKALRKGLDARDALLREHEARMKDAED